MNRKWIKLSAFSALAAVATLAGLLAFTQSAAAQTTGPAAARGRTTASPALGLMVRGQWGGPDSSLVAVAATTLNVSQTDLVATLKTGKTIATVAAEKGVALDKIVDAFIAPRVTTINSAVASGRITQAQADAAIARMKAQVTAQLNSPFTPRGNGNGDGTCASFVDANGDGVCDNLGANQQPGAQRGPANAVAAPRGGGRWNR